MKKLKMWVSLFLIGSLVVGIGYVQQATATVPGINTIVNYNSTNTGVGGGGNMVAQLSEDSNIVTWNSHTHNIIAGDNFTGSVLYQRNLQTGQASMVSLKEDDSVALISDSYFATSRTGRYIVFTSMQSDVVTDPAVTQTNRGHLYLRDTVQGTTGIVDTNKLNMPADLADGQSSQVTGVSDDGRFVSFTSTARNLFGVGVPLSSASQKAYIKDMYTGEVINPIISMTGGESSASTSKVYSSCDGSLAVLSTVGTDLTSEDNGKTNVYLIDLRNGHRITNLTYNADQGSSVHDISCNGRYILLWSKSTNLTADTVTGANYHYFRYDRLSGEYELIDKSSSGYVPSVQPRSNTVGLKRQISDNGRVVFFSPDPNIISPASSYTTQVYIRNPEAGTTEVVPVDNSGAEYYLGPNSYVQNNLGINARGDRVTYNTQSTIFVPGVVGSSSGVKIIISNID